MKYRFGVRTVTTGNNGQAKTLNAQENPVKKYWAGAILNMAIFVKIVL